MKRLTLAAALVALCAGWAGAKPVDTARAKAAAVAFMQEQTGRSTSVRDVQAQADGYYIFNLSPSGWAIVSSDDVAQPVLGYSTSGNLAWHSLPEQMGAMLAGYQGQIKLARERGLSRADAGWARLSGVVRTQRTATDDGLVKPLINVNWDQGSPYNQLCPSNQSTRAYVGCVAVAMAQAMSVQQYPPRPQGIATAASTEYATSPLNLDAEPAYEWAKILSGADNFYQTARLLRDAGYSVRMNYGSDGSGIPSSQPYLISDALVNNFAYGRNDVKYIWRDSYRGDWQTLIMSEIQAGRAVVYCAVDTKGGYGHAFNIDGYSGNEYFHVNWGWGGYGNGDFRLSALSDASTGMNYDSSHVAITGIGSPDRLLRSIELSDNVIDEGLEAGSVVGVITINGAAPTADMTLTVRGPYNAQMSSYSSVPFDIVDGNLVTTERLTATSTPYEVTIVVVASGERLTWTYAVTVCPLRTLAQATSMTYDRQAETFAVHIRTGASYTLRNAQGAVVSQGTPHPVPSFTFSRSQLTDGDNTLTVSHGTDSKTIVIKK